MMAEGLDTLQKFKVIPSGPASAVFEFRPADFLNAGRCPKERLESQIALAREYVIDECKRRFPSLNIELLEDPVGKQLFRYFPLEKGTSCKRKKVIV